jgi:hypothetical protein
MCGLESGMMSGSDMSISTPFSARERGRDRVRYLMSVEMELEFG